MAWNGFLSPEIGSQRWERKVNRQAERESRKLALADQKALEEELGVIDPKFNFNQVSSGFNTVMSGISNRNQSEGNRLFGQIKDIGGNFLSGATSSGGFNIGAGLKGSAGGLTAIGGDLIARGGQALGRSKYGDNITSAQNNTRSAIRQGIASFGPIG